MTHKQIMEALLSGEILIDEWDDRAYLYKMIGGNIHLKLVGSNLDWTESEDGSVFSYHGGYSSNIDIYEPEKIKKEMIFYVDNNEIKKLQECSRIGGKESFDLYDILRSENRFMKNKITISWEEDEKL